LFCRDRVINSIIAAILKEGNPLSVNILVFTSAISGQGTPEQQEMWLQRALNYNILGTYAQVRTGVVTELLHFTCVAGQEISTFLREHRISVLCS
jgi:acyl-CoA oxidase